MTGLTDFCRCFYADAGCRSQRVLKNGGPTQIVAVRKDLPMVYWVMSRKNPLLLEGEKLI